MVQVDSFDQVFAAVCEYCKKILSDVNYTLWIEDLEPLKLMGLTAYLKAKSEFKRNIIIEKYQDILLEGFAEILGFDVELVIEYDEKKEVPAVKEIESYQTSDYEYTFDNFVVGSSNKFAHAAALAVATNPSKAYNPLFIYYSEGVEKPHHLVHAIGNEIKRTRLSCNIIYKTGEEFTNEFIRALKNSTTHEFRDWYCAADVLLIEDIQFISGKESVQEEFFHIFDALYQDEKQIVITSDRPPKEIQSIDDRLRSRFEWGLLADIQPPDFETRTIIIRRKAELLGFNVPTNVVEYMANRLKNNACQLEDAVKRLKAYSVRGKQRPSIMLAQIAIRDILSDRRPLPTMSLCFGTFAKVLLACGNKGFTKTKLIATLVKSIEVTYEPVPSIISNLSQCKANLPIKIRSSLTSPHKVVEYFSENIISFLHPNTYRQVVLAIREIILHDDIISENEIVEIVSSTTKQALNEQSQFMLPHFLAGVFLYTVYYTDNKIGKDSLDIINDDFWNIIASKLESIDVIVPQNNMLQEQLPAKIVTNNSAPIISDPFVGREHECQVIKRYIEENVGIVLVNGVSGIGKTEMCKKLFFEYYNQTGGKIKYLGWIPYEGNIQESLLMEFPLNSKTNNPHIPIDAVKELINSLADNLLLFIDDVCKVSEKDKILLNNLKCSIIITSQLTELENAMVVRVEELPLSDCVRIYKDIAGQEHNDTVVRQIVERTAQIPYVVKLFADISRKINATDDEMLDLVIHNQFSLNSRYLNGEININDHLKYIHKRLEELETQKGLHSIMSEKSFDDLMRPFHQAIRSSDYCTAFELLSELEKADNDRYEILSKELAFLFDRSKTLEDNEKSWERYKDTIKDKVALWDFLKHDYLETAIDQIPIYENENEKSEIDQEKQIKETDISQKIGEDLEVSVVDIFKELFKIDNSELIELRKQLAGTQNGFDIKFKYKDKFDSECNCRIECKAGNQIITSSMVSGKLDELRRTIIMENETIHHWILISPKGSKANDLDDALKLWECENRWDPIQKVQIWNRDCDVNEFFGIVPKVFKKYYPNDKKVNPDKWDEHKRKKVINKWKDKIKPAIPLSKAWKDYFYDPSNLLTHTEQDSKNIKKYNSLFKCYSHIPCLDEAGNFLDESAEDYIVQWAKSKDDKKQALLILGEYGDGKTFLTYSVSRKLAEDYKKSPSTGVIPLRFTLRDLKENRYPQDFLRTRFESFGAQLNEFKTIKMNHSVVIILDGFDEMSLNMDSITIEKNILRLRDCINDSFKELKLIITSRTPIYKKFKHLLPGRIDISETIRLAPISRANKISYISSHIEKDAVDMIGRFNKLCHTHDLLGLASKALYLDMMKDTLLEDVDIVTLDKVKIYNSYVNSTLNRKREYWELDGRAVDFKEVFDKLIRLMEDIALIIFVSYPDGITFEYLTQYHDDQLALQLWKTMTSPTPVDIENANNRIINRSLLKATDLEDTYTFCHRSMQEYFAAKAICRLLTENPNEVEALLSKTDLTFETIDFASDILKSLSSESEQIKETLISFIEYTRGQSNDDVNISRIGSTAISLYFRTWESLPDIDYSNLVLDNAYLPEANFSNKKLINASLRNSNLDNATFINADLTLCDLTGVRFEETKDIYSMRGAIDPLDGERYLYVLYSDGRMRKWGIHDSKRVEITGGLNNAYIGMPYYGLTLYQRDNISFVKNVEDGIELCGGITLDESTIILDILNNSVLFSKNNSLVIYNIKSKQHMLFDRYPIGINQKAIIIDDTSALVFTDNNGQGIIMKHDDANIKYFNVDLKDITAAAVIQDDKRDNFLRICVGDRHGNLVLYDFDNSWDKKADENVYPIMKVIAYDCRQYLKTICFLDCLRIAYSGTDGIVHVLEHDEYITLKKETQWHLAVRCKGAILDNVKQQEQYEKLKAYRDFN